MRINQRDIVEVCFELPDGRLKEHPAIVISGQEIPYAEDLIYTVLISLSNANMEFAIELADAMVTKPMRKRCFVKWHLIQSYQPGEVLNVFGSVRLEAFNRIKAKIIDSIFS